MSTEPQRVASGARDIWNPEPVWDEPWSLFVYTSIQLSAAEKSVLSCGRVYCIVESCVPCSVLRKVQKEGVVRKERQKSSDKKMEKRSRESCCACQCMHEP